MNKLLSITVLLVAGLWLAACQQDPQSANPVMRPDPSHGSSGGGGFVPANPAIAYSKTHVTTSHGVGYTYYDIAVMDTDGTHQTAIYTAPGDQSSYVIWWRPTWSPDGGSVAFTQSSSSGRSILARDVAVVSGVATGSNTRTVYSNSDLYNTPISWSSTTSTNAIAFVTRPNGTYSTNSIMRVSASGGSATVLYQSPSGYSGLYRCPTWSNDDSKIAFIDHPGAATSGIADTLRVIDAATGALLAANALPTTTASVIEWSRTGMDTLVLGLPDKSKVYYVGPMTGTISTNNVAGGNPTWSPNNSSIAGSTTAGAWQKTATFTTSTSNVVSGAASDGVWKRY